MSVTRISKIKGFDNILAGRDLANIFKDGHVYSIREICGEIIFTDLGEHALMDKHIGSTYSRIISDGTYLLTQEEIKTC